jgi:hypothetical protein
LAFWRKLFGLEPSTSLAPGHGWIVQVVGESQYQEVLESLYRMNGGVGHDIKVIAGLVPEDNNSLDSRAVRVEIDSCRVGYLPRDMALEYRAALGEFVGQCSAKIVGGFKREDGTLAFFGVKLNLAWPPRIN